MHPVIALNPWFPHVSLPHEIFWLAVVWGKDHLSKREGWSSFLDYLAFLVCRPYWQLCPMFSVSCFKEAVPKNQFCPIVKRNSTVFFLCCFNILLICSKKVSRKHIGPLFPVSKRRFQKRQYWPSVSLFKASTGSSLSNNVLPVRHRPSTKKMFLLWRKLFLRGL